MKPFMTALEIADAALPDLPSTERSVQRKASQENWQSRPREGRGGGREYAVINLPQSAISELAFRDVEASASLAKMDDAPLDPYGESKSSARAAILLNFEQYVGGSGLTVTIAADKFAARYNAKKLCIRPWILKAVPTVSSRSLRRWSAKAKKTGVEGLKDKQRGPKGQNRFDKDANLAAYIIAQIAGRPHVAATHIYAGIEANFENPPSLRSLQLYVKKYRAENTSALLYAANPDQWKSHRRAAFGSLSADVLRLNQKWEIDGTIADVQCIGPEGKPMRYSLVALVDVFSRRAKVLVTEQPSAIATAACLRSAILDWGLPEILKADNGKDYTAAHVERIALDLGFRIDYCTPFSPEQKPHVERFFGTLSRELFEIIPGYTGHNVSDQQAIRSQRSMAQRHGATKTHPFTLAPGELQIVINDWIKDVYERRVHSGIKDTPFQKAIGHRTRKIDDERALDLLLAPPVSGDGVRIVQKKGVSVYARWFVSPELAGLIGERVSIRLDPEDKSRIVIYSVETQEFICLAEDPTLTGADLQEIAKRARHVQSSKLKSLKAQQKAAVAAHNPDRIGSDVLGHAAQNASKVTPIRAPYIEVSSPALDRAKDAVAGIDDYSSEPEPLSDYDAKEAMKAIEELEAATSLRAAPELTVHYADPLKRPNFATNMSGEVEFWKWAKNLKSQGLLDDETQKELREMEDDHTFQLYLESVGVIKKQGVL